MRILLLITAILGLMSSSAVADDWVAAKLRGRVLQQVEEQWLPVHRGDIVPDDRVVRTLGDGRVEFRRDEESIALGPNTQIQIHDTTGQRYTTVTQYFGDVTVEAEVQNVQHFEVKTPYLASVVKGTKFIVHSGPDTSTVEVLRGHVAVESEVTHATSVVSAGQSATASSKAELQVQGKGDLPPVISAKGVVLSEDGKPVSPQTDLAGLAKQLKEAAKTATGAEKKALERAAKTAEQQAKAAEKAAKDAQKASEQATKDANKAAEKASKEAEKAAKDAEKRDKDAKKKGK